MVSCSTDISIHCEAEPLKSILLRVPRCPGLALGVAFSSSSSCTTSTWLGIVSLERMGYLVQCSSVAHKTFHNPPRISASVLFYHKFQLLFVHAHHYTVASFN